MRPLIKWPVMWFQVSTPDLPCAVPELLGMPPSIVEKGVENRVVLGQPLATEG